MLDIRDKFGKIIAVIMDDGTVIKKEKAEDDIDELVKQQLEKEKGSKRGS